MSVRWLTEYFSLRLNMDRKYTKEELLHLAKLLFVSEEVSEHTVERINRRLQNKA